MWLTGGVAVDFLVGRWTRAHKDLDLVAFSTDREVLHAELRERDITLINEGTWTTRWTIDGRPVGEIEIVFLRSASPNTGVVVIEEGDPGGVVRGVPRLRPTTSRRTTGANSMGFGSSLEAPRGNGCIAFREPCSSRVGRRHRSYSTT
jgi:hypothetical protein